MAASRENSSRTVSTPHIGDRVIDGVPRDRIEEHPQGEPIGTHHRTIQRLGSHGHQRAHLLGRHRAGPTTAPGQHSMALDNSFFALPGSFCRS